MSSRRTPLNLAGLVLTLVVIAAFVVWPAASPLLASFSGPGPAGASGFRGLSSRDAKIALIERETSAIRGLRPLRPVRIRFMKDAAFNRYISGVFRKGETPEQIRISDIESVLLGMIPPSTNLKSILTQDLAAQVEGLYDHKTKRLYIRDDGQALGIDRWTIAHEFTHALQDQHFNLSRVQPDQTAWKIHNSDAELAQHSLIEGDAMDVQYAYLDTYYSAAERVALARQLQAFHSPPVPRVIEEQFNFPYTAGPAYVNFLLNHGGRAALNRSFGRPPDTTYQLMFPGKVIHPQPLKLRRVQGAFRRWKVADDDVNGAFGYQQLVELYVNPQRAGMLAAMWRGDRYLLLQHGKAEAMLLDSVYASRWAATQAEAILRASLAGRFHALHSFANGTWAGRAHVYAAIRSRSSYVYIAYGGSPAIARELVTSKTG